MKTTATKEVLQPVQATTTLPANYRRQATVGLSESRPAIVGAISSAIVLLIGVGWLLVQLCNLLRPTALEAIGFRDIVTITPDGNGSFEIPFVLIVDFFAATVLVLLIHELVHGVFYWRFAGQRPMLGIKGLLVYVAAPAEVYFPRNQYLIVGIAPFVLLTPVGFLLMLVVPVVVVPLLIFFVAFNAAGAAGDLLMCAWLLSYSPDAFIQDSGTGMIVYEPEKSQSAT